MSNAKRGNSKPPFAGRWQIVSMTEWDKEYLNEEVEAFIEFASNNLGSFQFGYVQGAIDYRSTDRDSKPAVEFSWEGGDGAAGRSWMGGPRWRRIERNDLHSPR